MNPIKVQVAPSGLDTFAQWMTIFLSIFTLLLFLVGAYQIWVARKTMRIQLRPHAYTHDIASIVVVDPRSGKVVGWRFVPKWMNAGSSPTHNFHNFIEAQLLDRNENHRTEFPEVTRRTQMDYPTLALPPQVKIDGGGSELVDLNSLIAIKAQQKILIIRGWGQYTDSLKPKKDSYRTEFCYYVTVQGDPTLIECAFYTSFHGAHNRTDQSIAKKFSRID